jgi:hypothetical protein
MVLFSDEAIKGYKEGLLSRTEYRMGGAVPGSTLVPHGSCVTGVTRQRLLLSTVSCKLEYYQISSPIKEICCEYSILVGLIS